MSNRTVGRVAQPMLPGRRWMGPVAVLALAVAGVAIIAEGVLERGDLAAYDPGIGRWFVAERTPLLTPMAAGLAVLGGPALWVLIVTAVAWLWLRRFRGDAVFVAATTAVAGIVTSGMKLLFARPRPTADVIGAIARSYAFPSGHTVNTTVFVGLLGLLAWRARPAPASRVVIAVVWAASSLTMAASRVYLADHWFTDVVGGLVTAVGLLAGAVLVRRVVALRHAGSAAAEYARTTAALPGHDDQRS
ncbi:MAG TPA: phosphatase PAP2 family protein [Propionibacteriaceae bacterium]|nr:phosphatase PAP2 family protein [Propionibacteriaceae bacterium]